MPSATPPRRPLADRTSPIEIVCHRGAIHSAPENTIASAEQAIASGADYIEFDIAMSADREYFVIHDTTVDRTTDGAGSVAELSAAKLDSLDAGSWFSADFAGERVPRLRAFLQTVRGRAKLFVDIKAGVPEEFIGLIREAGMAQDCFFWSEEPEMIEKTRRFDPDLRIMARFQDHDSLDEAKARHGASIIEVQMEDYTPDLVGACRERGMELMICYHGDDPETFREIIRSGASLVNLDHLAPFLEAESRLAA